ncbi:hypothetical protein AVEN_108999-1 [Araneus ventricosus]|uniref:Uncharacterized protein n=1 Tax=Araneus ventricosus TaxID=182803 RepID=A0A4Y2PXK4_ARAVE|nr:hypothetical protein AVEN_108999-1 [Araneus ventricosus]
MFTRWVEAVPMVDQTTRTLHRFFYRNEFLVLANPSHKCSALPPLQETTLCREAEKSQPQRRPQDKKGNSMGVILLKALDAAESVS